MGGAENERERTWVDMPDARPSSESSIKDVIGAGFTHGPDSEFAVPSAGAFGAGGRADLMPPCSVLAELTGQAVEADLRRLSDDELVGVMRAALRNESWQAAVRLAAIDELASRRQAEVHDAGPAPAERAAAEIAVALTLPDGTAARLLDFATGLAMLDDVGRWLQRGLIDVRKAEVFVDELSPLPWLQASIIAIEYLGVAPGMTSSQLRAALRRAVLAADPEAGRRRQRDGRKQARVEWWSEHSGNGALAGRELPSDRAIRADEHITALAKSLKSAGVPGTLDQLKAEVFIALVTGQPPDALLPPLPGAPARAAGTASSADTAPAAVTAPAEPSHVAPQPVQWPPGPLGTVHLTMPLSAWAGLTNRPGEIAGYGPSDAWTCRDMVATMATWDDVRYCVTITTEDGQPLGHACAKRAPPQPAAGPAPPRSAGPTSPTRPAFRHGAGPPGEARDGTPDDGIAAWIAGLRIEWLQRGTCDHSRETASYRPSRLLDHLIKIRNPTCTAPGCRRPARRSDIDHVVPYHLGGRTCECNCHPGCRRHHRCKGSAGWELDMVEPGVLVWRLPHGREYVTRAEPYPV
jgi:hypothetical protein